MTSNYEITASDIGLALQEVGMPNGELDIQDVMEKIHIESIQEAISKGEDVQDVLIEQIRECVQWE